MAELVMQSVESQMPPRDQTSLVYRTHTHAQHAVLMLDLRIDGWEVCVVVLRLVQLIDMCFKQDMCVCAICVCAICVCAICMDAMLHRCCMAAVYGPALFQPAMETRATM